MTSRRILEARPFRSSVKAFEDGYRPYLPTVVLAQVWRNRTRQHPVRMVRRLCLLLPCTEQNAEDVGRLPPPQRYV
ncbi:MAG TPA: hypothetical protein VFQ77_18375 [Pseudonocardiaceae bacterium]|nr:hypothetical protein [Pseudonocardiaceae bacterium]